MRFEELIQSLVDFLLVAAGMNLATHQHVTSFIVPYASGGASLNGDDHLLGEIGEAMAGSEGRRSEGDVTIYKSLGSIVQDLAAARHIVTKLGREDRI